MLKEDNECGLHAMTKEYLQRCARVCRSGHD